MDEKALFLKFWEKEAPATRKVLSRIPQEKSDYKPDPKSRTAREIAWLLVHEETFLAEGLERGQFEWVEQSAPATVAENPGGVRCPPRRPDRAHEGPPRVALGESGCRSCTRGSR